MDETNRNALATGILLGYRAQSLNERKALFVTFLFRMGKRKFRESTSGFGAGFAAYCSSISRDCWNKETASSYFSSFRLILAKL